MLPENSDYSGELANEQDEDQLWEENNDSCAGDDKK
jgi:hypothetical protein